MNRKTGLYLLIGTLGMSFALSGCGGQQVAEVYDGRAKTIAVRANMVTVQAAAEKYFKDHTYMYPTQVDDEFKSYFPGGDPGTKKPGKPLLNPFTGVGEWPTLGTITDIAQARAATPTDMTKGALEYSAIEGGKNYAIRGGADTGKALHSEDAAQMGTLVLSRDDYKGGQ